MPTVLLLHPRESKINDRGMPYIEMVARNVYTEYEQARRNAIHKLNEDEQDVFVCAVDYPSGREYVLKTRTEMVEGGICLYHLKLEWWRFKFHKRDNALREANRLTKELGKDVGIERITVCENGYEKTLHYKLCFL